MPTKTLRGVSKDDYEVPDPNGVVSLKVLQVGALLRIADSMEHMAENHVDLQAKASRYERWYTNEKEGSDRLRRRISALQGVITKLKRKTAPPVS